MSYKKWLESYKLADLNISQLRGLLLWWLHHTQVFYFGSHHMDKCGLVLNLILNPFILEKAILRNCFNHLASIKLNKSNQLTSSVTLQISHTHPTHQLSLPWLSVSCSLCFGFALSRFFTEIFSSTLYRVLSAVVLSATLCLIRMAPRSQNLLQKVSSDFTCLQKVS